MCVVEGESRSGWLLRDIKVVRPEPLYKIFVTQQH